MNEREAFAYVVGVEGATVTLNLRNEHAGQLAAHAHGISSVTEIGGLFGVSAGVRLLVMRNRALSFAEARDAHRTGIGTQDVFGRPLRNIVATTMGTISREKEQLCFRVDSSASPALGAEAFPLTRAELRCILLPGEEGAAVVNLGEARRGGGNLSVPLSALLTRHVAVLGSTGQGKSCFTAAILQQVLRLPQPRIVVFDINGEYASALAGYASGPGELEQTTLGVDGGFRIPYYALGRHGLARLFLPSEKTQRPAINFALDHLRNVEWHPGEEGAGLASDGTPVLFDDGRLDNASAAGEAIKKLRTGGAGNAKRWPHMRSLACLVSESQSIKEGRYGIERDAWAYGHIAPLITRILRRSEDELFRRVVDVEGHDPVPQAKGRLDWQIESRILVDKIFGGPQSRWKLHIVDLRHVAHDLMPFVLGALLELLAFELFRRGQGATYPTLLVLEEAHHYLRELPSDEETGQHSLAYERLAKEGRKFGLSLWLSTQRPSEVSPTVLGQCGTWAAFRLVGEPDLRAVAAAAEWVDKSELNRIAGLPRQEAVIFGSSVAIPTRVVAPIADPLPESRDPDFSRWLVPLREEVGASAEAQVNTTEEAIEPPEGTDDDVPF